MARKRIPQKRVPELLAELLARDAGTVRRHPVRLDGTVLVTWRESGRDRVVSPRVPSR